MINENFGKYFAILSKITNLHIVFRLYILRNQWHFNDQDKANCLNDYFTSISVVNDAETQLHPLTKLTDISLSQINSTELEIENIIKVLTSDKASCDDGIDHKMLNGVSKTGSKSSAFK